MTDPGTGTLPRSAVDAPRGDGRPLDPATAVARWLAADPEEALAGELRAAIRSDGRIGLDDAEIAAVIRDARGEGLDAESTLGRLILQGEWLALDSMARIRPR